MKQEKIFSTLLILSIFLFLGISATTVFAASDTMDVNITIGAVSEITVLPEVLNWSDVSLGAVAGNKTVSIKNTGSVNVTQLYVYGDALTDETSRPYGLPNASYYSAASVIAVSNATGEKEYFLGRIEWNWTEDIQNLNTSGLSTPVSAGFFKNNSREFVWAVGAGASGTCNETDAEFAIEDDIDVGIMGTRTPDATDITNDGADENYAYFSDDRSTSPLNGYCIAVSTDCNRTYIYKYDKRAGFTGCVNAAYMTEDDITPGSMVQIDANAYIPRGIPAGEMIRATLTFVAT